MKTTVDAFHTCGCFLSDYEHVLDTATFKRVQGYLRSRDVARLSTCSKSTSGLASQEAGPLRVLLQVEAFFKKNASLSHSSDTKEAALAAFRSAEQLCLETNARLDNICSEHYGDFGRLVDRASSFIEYVLGPFEEFVARLPSLVRLTSGATATRSRSSSQPFRKATLKLQAPYSCEPYLSALANWFGYDKIKLQPTAWNRVVTVPKNWKTDRTIACEPGGSLPLQLAFDEYAKERLRLRAGIDLGDQSKNQHLAYLGSLSGSFATIDLEQASDTLAYNTVAMLLPSAWFRYLADVRSPLYKGEDGSLTTYAKFSSMGNGATFALETLIFAAACHAVGSRDLTVYGDDIIIESDLYDDVVGMLGFLGFKVNVDKTYASGPYRESCGAHYCDGVYVTPFYLRTNGNSKSELCHIVNGLASLGYEGGRLWAYARELVHEASLPFVPFNPDTMSGVHITVQASHEKKLLRPLNWSHERRCYLPSRHSFTFGFKGYTTGTATRSIADSRTLFLWHLQASRRKVEFPDPDIEVYARNWRSGVVVSSVVSELAPTRGRGWTVYFHVDGRCLPPWLETWAAYVPANAET